MYPYTRHCCLVSRRLICLIKSCHFYRDMSVGNNNSPTAGIIIIGDEILKGQTNDTNSYFLCKRLFSLGVDVRKISVVHDNVIDIANEVRDFASKYTHVITSGGIGPTHDDITFEGVALAFGEKIIPHPELVQICRQFFGQHHGLDSSYLKLAHVPESARLLYGENKILGKKASYPLIIVRNVVIFPGVPALLEKAFVLLEDMYKNPEIKFHVKEIYCTKDEFTITENLNSFVEKYKNKIILGSYPEIFHSYYKVRLTLQSENELVLQEGYDYLLKVLKKDSVVFYNSDPVFKVADQVYDFILTDSPLVEKIRSSLEVVENCFGRFKFSDICIGFNGGKDCTALLYLIQAVLKKKYHNVEQLQAVYIRGKHPFKEVEQFISQTCNRYNLNMFKFNGNIKEALEQLKEQRPNIKAVFMGTRRTDPYSVKLEPFSLTDADWPEFTRINPILDWDYHDVWSFIRHFYLPYCILYDKGYTSLGNVDDTWPNPSLQFIDKHGRVCYKPAYQLDDGEEERHGRK